MCVGDAGAVLLVGPCAFFTVAQPVITLGVRGADGVLELCGLLIDSSSAVCGYFLPLKPARQRRFSLEVKVPAAAVLLSDLLQLQLQVPAQLVVVHWAKQTPANRLSAPDGIHPSDASGGVLVGKVFVQFKGELWLFVSLWSALVSSMLQGDLKAAGHTMFCLYTMSRGC